MKENWKVTTLVLGTIVGALLGAGAAYFLVKNAESENKAPKISAQQGLQAGLGLLGILRQMTSPTQKK